MTVFVQTKSGQCLEFSKLAIYFLITSQLLLFAFVINDNYYGSDFGNYWQGAQSLLSGLPYSTHGNPEIPDNFRPIGYPALLAIFDRFFGENYQLSLIGFQSLLYLVMLKLSFRSLKLLKAESFKSVLLVGLLFSHPTMLYTTTQMQCDILVAFFAALYIFSNVKFWGGDSKSWLYWSMVFLALSLYFRPTYLYYIPIAIYLIYRSANLRVAIVSTIIAIAIISPWIARNKVEIGTYKFSLLGDVALGYIAGDTLRHGYNLEPNDAYQKFLADSGAGIHFEADKNDLEIYRKMNKHAMEVIVSNPTAFSQAFARGVVRVVSMPHEIYSIKNDLTVPVDVFGDYVKNKPQKILGLLNAWFMYLYIFPYIINLIIVYGLVRYAYQFRRLYHTLGLKPIMLSTTTFVLYGWLIPGPINKSHYISLYFFGLELLLLFGFFGKNLAEGSTTKYSFRGYTE